MRIQLTPPEARVIGCLIEKEITTPAQYPLSLSALTTACNQKSSREPVMHLSDADVQDIVDGLVRKHLVSGRSGFGSRVDKYRHRFANVGFGSLEFSAQEIGILCLLLLRGPQTPGELRSRSHRLCEFGDVAETESVLKGLAERRDGPFVARLTREPGRREARYAHLFGDPETHDATPAADTTAAVGASSTPDAPPPADTAAPAAQAEVRIAQLEDVVLTLQQELDAVKTRLAALESVARG